MNKEMGRLFQGYQCPRQTHDAKGTDTCSFIHKHELLPDTNPPMYGLSLTTENNQYSVRCTVGGSLIDFPVDKSPKAADLVTIKCLLNDPSAWVACMDIKDFYLNSPLPQAEYIRYKANTIPTDGWIPNNLENFVDNRGHVYARVDKGMHALPQVGKVASDCLLPRLADVGYTEAGVTPGPFQHATNSIIFALVVDDFLVKNSADRDWHTCRTPFAHTTR
jgi:hypothetical protein